MVSSLHSSAPFVLGVFSPTSPRDGWLKVLGPMGVCGCAEEQAGTAWVCKREGSPCRNGWMISDGVCLVAWQASSEVLSEWVHRLEGNCVVSGGEES